MAAKQPPKETGTAVGEPTAAPVKNSDYRERPNLHNGSTVEHGSTILRRCRDLPIQTASRDSRCRDTCSGQRAKSGLFRHHIWKESANIAQRPGPKPRAGESGNETVIIRLKSLQKYRPPVTLGDREFYGHGPSMEVKAELAVVNNAVYRRLWVQAIEHGGNTTIFNVDKKTHMDGWSRRELVYTPPEGKQILSLGHRGNSFSETLVDWYMMSGHASKTFRTPLGTVTLYGDRDGKDDGYTGADVQFDHEVTLIWMNKKPMPVGRVNVPLPKRFTIRTKHVRGKGDKDFHGNGPHVVVNVGIQHSWNRVFFVGLMSAKEIKGDGTTAEGTEMRAIYIVPSGHRIKAIHGKKEWLNIVDQEIRGHRPREIQTPLGKVIVYGDHQGDDTDTYTASVFDQIVGSITVEIEPIRP